MLPYEGEAFSFWRQSAAGAWLVSSSLLWWRGDFGRRLHSISCHGEGEKWRRRRAWRACLHATTLPVFEKKGEKKEASKPPLLLYFAAFSVERKRRKELHTCLSWAVLSQWGWPLLALSAFSIISSPLPYTPPYLSGVEALFLLGMRTRAARAPAWLFSSRHVLCICWVKQLENGRGCARHLCCPHT